MALKRSTMVEFLVGTGRFSSVVQPLDADTLSDRKIVLLAPVNAYAFCTFVLEHEEAFTPQDTPEGRREVSSLCFLGGEVMHNRMLSSAVSQRGGSGAMHYSSGSRVIRTRLGVPRNMAPEDRFIDLP